MEPAEVTTNASQRPRRWKVVVPLFVAAGLVAGCIGAFGLVSGVQEAMLDSYAQMWITDILIQHMERNEGKWPTGWDDLKEPFEVVAGQYGGMFTLEDLRHRIAIDFNVEPAQLATASTSDGETSFRVISLRNGKQHHWEGLEPNFVILEYLRKRAARPASYEPPEPLASDERDARRQLVRLGTSFEVDRNGHVVTVQMTSKHHGNADLLRLKELAHLRELNLGDSSIGDQGLEHIETLDDLECLYLYRTEVTDDGLAHLQQLRKLNTLILADNNFTDAALPHIAKMNDLKVLNLNGSRVTDAGLKQLYLLNGLSEVMLYDTQVTDDGVRNLQEAIPNCKISR